MSQVSRDTPAGEAYLDLQRQARKSRRPTEELLQLYVLEGFLARLAVSALRETFVLKGGVLLAAFDNRRPTRDVDLAGRNVSNDASVILDLVRSVLTVVPGSDDGIAFQTDTARAEVIREDDQYSGVRVSVDCRLDRAQLKLHIDVNVGDPIWPESTVVLVPRMRGGEPISLVGYPLPMVHAEKIVTAVQRGTVNTRWRDFADIWTLSRHHPVDGSDLQHAIGEVARHRGVTLAPLQDVLDGYADLGQAKWSMWRRRNDYSHLPERFTAVLDEVIRFAEPAVGGEIDGRKWNPNTQRWQ